MNTQNEELVWRCVMCGASNDGTGLCMNGHRVSLSYEFTLVRKGKISLLQELETEILDEGKQKFLTTLNIMMMEISNGKDFMEVHESFANRLVGDVLSLLTTKEGK